MKVLFCESSPTWRRIWKRLTEPRHDFAVISRATPEELDIAADQRPDVVVVRRESVDMAALVRGIRAHSELSDLPLVVATSSSSENSHGDDTGLEAEQVDAVLAMPCVPAAFDAELEAVVARRSRLGRRRPLAVLVDDSTTIRQIEKKQLQDLGFDVLEAADGTEGEALIRATLPNLAIVDIEMPGISGLDLCGHLAADPRTSGIPVLVVSGVVDLCLVQRGFEAGAIDFLKKPFTQEQLSQTVSALVRRDHGSLACAFVLEDCPVTASIISKLLRELGLTVHVAPTLAAFRALASVGAPDLVTVDVQVPDGSGIDLVRELRTDERFENVPIVVVSGNQDREVLVESLRAGANDFLVKPFLREEMIIRATNLLTTSRLRSDVERRSRELERLAYRDALTGLGNRRMFEEAVRSELAVAKRWGGSLAVLALDLDHFKKINDTYGHAAGDEVLREVGRMIARSVRPTDVACRYGGEEIFILAPGCDAAGAERFAERLRARCASLVIGTAEIRPTMSIGVSVYPELSTPESLLEDSDAALYRAKQGGRNRAALHVSTKADVDKVA